MDESRDIIAEIGGNLGSVGCGDLRGVVALTLERDIEGLEYLKMETVLEEFEGRTGRKATTVSKSLGRVTTAIWESGNKDALREVYHGYLPSCRPSPKSLIIRLAYYERQRRERKGGD